MKPSAAKPATTRSAEARRLARRGRICQKTSSPVSMRIANDDRASVNADATTSPSTTTTLHRAPPTSTEMLIISEKLTEPVVDRVSSVSQIPDRSATAPNAKRIGAQRYCLRAPHHNGIIRAET